MVYLYTHCIRCTVHTIQRQIFICIAVKWNQTKAVPFHRSYQNIHEQRTVMSYRSNLATVQRPTQIRRLLVAAHFTVPFSIWFFLNANFFPPDFYCISWLLICIHLNITRGGWDSSVGIATCYGLDGPGIESRGGGGGEIFRTRPDRPWGPPSLLYNGYRVFQGGKAAGAWC